MSDIVQEGNSFVVREAGEMAAEITFVPQGAHTIVIDHTYVSEALRGQKLAESLVQKVVEYARENGKTIIPACSYAHAFFRRHKDVQDVWQK